MTYKFQASLIAILAAVLSLLGLSVHAQPSLVENFDYAAGPLIDQGTPAWMSSKSNYANNPIQVVDEQLSYEGYPTPVPAKAVRLVSYNQNEHLQRLFDTSDNGIASGTIWYSALIRVDKTPSAANYFLTLGHRTTASDVFQGKIPSEKGRIFMGPGADADHFQLGVDLSGTKPSAKTADLAVGTTHLVVAKLEINPDGDFKDAVTLYVDPTDFKNEPTEAVGTSKAAGATGGNGYKSISLSQQLAFNGTSGIITLAALRLSDTYAGMFKTVSDGGVTPPETVDKTPVITFGDKIAMGFVFDGLSYTKEVTVKGKDLTADLTLTSDNDQLTFSRNVIPAEEAMSANGASVTLTLKPVLSVEDDPDFLGQDTGTKMTIASEGAESVVTELSWHAYATVKVAALKEFQSKSETDYEYLLYTGDAVVSYVDRSVNPCVVYLQDADGGLTMSDGWGTGTPMEFKVGDVLSRFVTCVGTGLGGVNSAYPAFPGEIVPVRTGEEVKAVPATIGQLKGSPATYLNRLVRISSVKLSGFDPDAVFAEGMAQPTFTDASEATGKVRIFKGTDLIGKQIPTDELDLTGILTSKAMTNGPIVAPRTINDLALLGEAGLTLDKASFLKARGKVGERVLVGTVTASAVRLAAPVTITPSSAVAGIFEASPAVIPAGTGDHKIDIYYLAPEVGKHKGNLYLEAGDDYFGEIRLEGIAVDPNNPPTLQIEPTEIPAFKAVVGETVTATVNLTPLYNPDFINVKLEQAVPGFLLSTSMLAAKGEQKMTVTFRPSAAGDFSAKVTFSNEFLTPVVLELKGTATDKVVEPEKEGDDLPLTTDGALTLLNEGFTGLTHNKALSLQGWKNIAARGYRAWWGYTFPEYDEENAGEGAAKVTAYDSSVGEDEETPCEMFLITPPLDFNGSASKLFTFRVMGNNLRDDMTETLELCYIYTDAEGTHYEAIPEVAMPAAKDFNGEWQEFHVDLNGQPLDDVFFMGFRFTGMRGKNNSAVYYIDDVSYGRTDVPLITSTDIEVEIGAAPGQTATSRPVTIEGRNLTEPIKLALGGYDKGLFELSTAELPATGGDFIVKFKGDAGEYEAYVKLSSRGAADKYIIFIATAATGIQAVTAEAGESVTLYDTAGRLVLSTDGEGLTKGLHGLPRGTYIVKVSGTNGERTMKIAK